MKCSNVFIKVISRERRKSAAERTRQITRLGERSAEVMTSFPEKVSPTIADIVKSMTDEAPTGDADNEEVEREIERFVSNNTLKLVLKMFVEEFIKFL